MLPPEHPLRSTSTTVAQDPADPNPGFPPTAAAAAEPPTSPTAAELGVVPRPAFPHMLELDLSCSGSAVGGSIELQIDLLQAAMPMLRVLKLSGLGGFYGEL